jgi:prepilin-type N-terminal cleavage/methylation domain-containing protein
MKGNGGFSLIELSIVLVIVGFLITGGMTAMNMVNQLKLKSVITDFNKFQMAYNNFVGRYNEVPGDMPNAHEYFKECAEYGKGCSGGGNGTIDDAKNDSGIFEYNLAWKHLEFAGLLEKNINVHLVQGPSTKVNINAPASRIRGAGYLLINGKPDSFNLQNNTDIKTSFSKAKDNVILLGRNGSSHSLSNGALTPREAFIIIQKMDDGHIDEGKYIGGGSGRVRAYTGQDHAPGSCVDDQGVFNINSKERSCVLVMKLN